MYLRTLWNNNVEVVTINFITHFSFTIFFRKALPNGEFQDLCKPIMEQVCLGKRMKMELLLSTMYWTSLKLMCCAILGECVPHHCMMATFTQLFLSQSLFSLLQGFWALKRHLRLSEPVLECRESNFAAADSLKPWNIFSY